MKGKLSNAEKKDLALAMFIETDKQQKEICDLVDINEKTFTRWKQEGGWEELKAAEVVTSKRIISNLYRKLLKLSEDEQANSDHIIKLSTSIEKLSDKRVTVPQFINAFKEFTTWLMMKDPEKAKEVSAWQKKFIDDKING